MKYFVFITYTTLVLVGCQRDMQNKSDHVYFCDVSLPHVVGMGSEVFEDPSNDFSKYPQVNGLVKGDRIWEIGNLEKIPLGCDLSSDLKQLFISKVSDVRPAIISVWHTYGILKFDGGSYGLSINFVDSIVKCEKIVTINDHANLMKSEFAANSTFVVSIDYLRNNHSCFYGILKRWYRSAKVNIGEEQYGFP